MDIKDKKIKLNKILREFVDNSRDDLEGVVNKNGLSMLDFYTYIDQCGYKEKFDSIRWHGRLTKSPVKKTLKHQKTLNPAKALAYSEVLERISRGESVKHACGASGVTYSSFRDYVYKHPEVKAIYDEAIIQQKEAIIDRRKEHHKALIQKADELIEQKLGNRVKRTLTKTTGFTQLPNGMSVPLDKEVTKIEEIEGDIQAAKLVYQLNGFLDKGGNNQQVNLQVNILEEMSKEEAKEVQDKSLEDLTDLKAQAEEMRAKLMRSMNKTIKVEEDE